MTSLVKYPMFKTYMSEGFTKDEILTDAMMTIQQRIMNMNDGERAQAGISADFLEKQNLLAMYDNGNIRFEYNERSMRDNPTYNISIDPDNSGIFMNLADPNDNQASYKPERNSLMSEALSLKKVRSEYQDKLWDSYFSGEFFNFGKGSGKKSKDEYFKTSKVSGKSMLMFNPYEDYGITNEEKPEMDAFMKGMFKVVNNAYHKGKNGIEDLGRMFNDIDWLPDVKFQLDTHERMAQREQQNFLIYQKNKAAGEFDESIASQFSGEVETQIVNKQGKKEKINMTIGTNLIYDNIRKHEGTKLTAYDPLYNGPKGNNTFQAGGVRGPSRPEIEMVSENSNITMEEYNRMIGPDGDPTIGTGLSLKDGTVIKELEALGYNIDKLIRGEETLTAEHDQIVVMKMIDQKILTVERLTGLKDLRTNKNAYLTAALVNMAYVNGDFIGKRFKKALNNFIRTGDMKYIGNYESYNQEEGESIFSKFKGNAEGINKYEPTLLNELWNDAEALATGKDKLGGFRTRNKDVAGLLMAWSQGQQTFFTDLFVEQPPQLQK